MKIKEKKLCILGFTYSSLLDTGVIVKDVNEKLNMWLGKDTIKFDLHKASANEFLYTFTRNHGRNYTEIDVINKKDDMVLSMDQQIVEGRGFCDNRINGEDFVFNLEAINVRIIVYDEIKAIAKGYKEFCRARGCTVPKKYEYLTEDVDRFTVKVRY